MSFVSDSAVMVKDLDKCGTRSDKIKEVFNTTKVVEDIIKIYIPCSTKEDKRI